MTGRRLRGESGRSRAMWVEWMQVGRLATAICASAGLALFLKYYLVNRVHPNADRYWKRIFTESRGGLWWWYPLRSLDRVLTRVPLVRRLAWNIVIWGRKAI